MNFEFGESYIDMTYEVIDKRGDQVVAAMIGFTVYLNVLLLMTTKRNATLFFLKQKT